MMAWVVNCTRLTKEKHMRCNRMDCLCLCFAYLESAMDSLDVVLNLDEPCDSTWPDLLVERLDSSGGLGSDESGTSRSPGFFRLGELVVSGGDADVVAPVFFLL